MCTIVLLLLLALQRATAEGSLPDISQYSPYYLPLNVLLLPKDQPFIFYSLLLQLVLCHAAALKSLPVHHLQYRLYVTFSEIFGLVEVRR